jgi:ribosomal silencing factor RsfS
VRKIGQEGSEGGSWVLIDYAIASCTFLAGLREYYSLETCGATLPKLTGTARRSNAASEQFIC